MRTAIPPSAAVITSTPETRPWRAFSIGSSGAGLMSCEVTVELRGCGGAALGVSDFPRPLAQPTIKTPATPRCRECRDNDRIETSESRGTHALRTTFCGQRESGGKGLQPERACE